MISSRFLCLFAVLAASQVLAQERQAVSALGRLEPEHGVVKVSAPSTPEAILGAILVELKVDEGDDVEQGQLLAVTDTAGVMEGLAREGEASLEFANREVNARMQFKTMNFL